MASETSISPDKDNFHRHYFSDDRSHDHIDGHALSLGTTSRKIRSSRQGHSIAAYTSFRPRNQITHFALISLYHLSALFIRCRHSRCHHSYSTLYSLLFLQQWRKSSTFARCGRMQVIHLMPMSQRDPLTPTVIGVVLKIKDFRLVLQDYVRDTGRDITITLKRLGPERSIR
jgi:hypothetical protein